jgi:putative membrane protein
VLDLLVKIVINAAALLVAAKLVPDIHMRVGPLGPEWIKVAAVALVFALINTYVRPIVKMFSLPITLLTLGLFALVINAALFLLLAWISTEILKLPFHVGDFPPKVDLTVIVAAIEGSIIVSIVSAILGLANFGRRLAFR